VSAPDRIERALAMKSLDFTDLLEDRRPPAAEVERLQAREAELAEHADILANLILRATTIRQAHLIARAALAGSPDTPAEQEASE
jgi:hypothetical protein